MTGAREKIHVMKGKHKIHNTKYAFLHKQWESLYNCLLMLIVIEMFRLKPICWESIESEWSCNNDRNVWDVLYRIILHRDVLILTELRTVQQLCSAVIGTAWASLSLQWTHCTCTSLWRRAFPLNHPRRCWRVLIVLCTEWFVGRLDWNWWVNVNCDVIQW